MNIALNVNSETYIVLLSVVGSFLAGILRQNSKLPWLNELITAIFIVVASALGVFLAGNLSPNLVSDITDVATQVTVLMAGPLKPLEQWAQITINPGVTATLLKFQTKTTAAYQPTPIQSLSSGQGNSDHSG